MTRRSAESANDNDLNNDDKGQDSPNLVRRRLLGAMGVGAAAIGASALPAVAQQRDSTRGGDSRAQQRGRGNGGGGADPGPTTPPLRTASTADDTFIRLFNDQPFAQAGPELREALTEIGKPGGMLDANDDLSRGPIDLIIDPALSVGNPNNPTHTAGTTFIGQFLDHDLTSDSGSLLGQPTPLSQTKNLRTSRLDLDSVYNGGPRDNPQLYERRDSAKLRVESGGLFEDLPRDDAGVAIVGDARNDENIMISGIQAAMLKFHNEVVDRVRSSNRRLDDDRVFAEARRIVTWHYQSMVLHEYLPQIVGQPMIDDILRNGRRYYNPAVAQIPVEFSGAAYRFGHSMIRPSYRANMAGDNGEPFFGMVFDPAEFGKPDPNDMSGRIRAPRRFVGWQTFFDFGDGEVKPNKTINTKISTPMFQLPIFTIPTTRGEDVGPTSLATRNLLRHITWELPSGQTIARRMGVPELSRGDLADFGSVGAALDTSTPLWIYVLRESEVMAQGFHLGPVGGRIVAETLIGVLQLDPTSYLNASPGWRPDLPTVNAGASFGMVDLLTLAGVDPTSRGQ